MVWCGVVVADAVAVAFAFSIADNLTLEDSNRIMQDERMSIETCSMTMNQHVRSKENVLTSTVRDKRY